jgi:DNA polymerase-3 subunit gamma/tau
MSSLVLARKYRPRRFGEMVGQEHVVQALVNALSSQRLHHAYLFTGTRGVGKTTVSRILAKSLNCVGPDGTGGITAEPCGVCRACTEIDADRFIDYVEMDAASNRGIDEIRDLLERAAYKPAVGRFKVFMIDEVHQLTKESFNALLKTLEEPPDYLRFVLATTDPEKVLPTVLSRCLQFSLRPMAPETVLGRLQAVLTAEGIEAEPGALRLLSRAARGSMRDALSLTDQAIAHGAGRIDEDGVRRMLGAVGRGPVLGLLDALAAGDGPALVAGVDALRAQGLSAEGTLEEMATVLQQAAVLQAVPGALDGSDDPDAPAIARLAAALPADETQLCYSIALHGRAELALAPDEYSGLVMVLLRMLAFRPAGAERPAAPPRPAAAAVPRPAVAAAPLVRTPVVATTAVPPPAPRRAPAAPLGGVPPWEEDIPLAEADAVPLRVAETAVELQAAAPDAAAWTATPLGDRWAALVRRLQDANAIAALVRELALQAECAAIDGDDARIRLRVERESLRHPAHAEKLQAALAALLGHAVALEVEAGAVGDTPARREQRLREQRQREAEALIRDDPLVRELTAQFKTARIVPGSIKPI